MDHLSFTVWTRVTNGTLPTTRHTVRAAVATCPGRRRHRATRRRRWLPALRGHCAAHDEEEIAVPDGEPLDLRLATPAGLVAAKSHAVGYPSSTRRATKHGVDLLDVVRLLDAHNSTGLVSDELRSAPDGLARTIADVSPREILAHPARAARMMESVAIGAIEADDVASTVEVFVRQLRR